MFFLLGFFSCGMLFYGFFFTDFGAPFGTGFATYEVAAPGDWVSEEDIILFEDRVVIRVNNATVSNYAPTKSMKPLFDYGSNGIRVVPDSPSRVEVGDIVSYRMNDSLVVHRVVEKGIDSEGIYFITRGDNNAAEDGKIRFEDIEYVTIGVLW